jgi:AraC-like DNA-binding protein
LRDDPTSPARWLDDIPSHTSPDDGNSLRYGGTGRLTELVCGGFVLEGGDVDPAAAVRLIYAEPARSWTVEGLAAEVDYSRSAFASRFRQIVGESPFAYLTRARLAASATLLDRSCR